MIRQNALRIAEAPIATCCSPVAGMMSPRKPGATRRVPEHLVPACASPWIIALSLAPENAFP
ncbi:hypothetical protein GCM10009076_21190 [Erythrobacter ramosus]